jgi:hypothetical protein
MGWSRRTISVDHETWENAKEVIQEETGLTMSKIIEIYLRGIARTKKGGLRDIIAGGVNDLIEMDNSLNARDKLKGFDLVDKIHNKVKKKK